MSSNSPCSISCARHESFGRMASLCSTTSISRDRDSPPSCFSSTIPSGGTSPMWFCEPILPPPSPRRSPLSPPQNFPFPSPPPFSPQPPPPTLFPPSTPPPHQPTPRPPL